MLSFTNVDAAQPERAQLVAKRVTVCTGRTQTTADAPQRGVLRLGEGAPLNGPAEAPVRGGHRKGPICFSDINRPKATRTALSQ